MTSLSPNSLESLAANLRNDGLPAIYVDRIVGELADHEVDIQHTAPFRSTSRRLGCIDDLRHVIVDGYRSQTFAGRHPRVTFILGSLTVAPACCIIYVLVVLAGFSALGHLLGISSIQEVISTPTALGQLEALLHCGSVLMYLGAAALIAHIAYASGSGIRWFLTASAIQTLVAVFTSLTFNLSLTPGDSSVAFGIGTAAPHSWTWPIVVQLAAQAAMPLVAARFALKRYFSPE